MLLFVEKLNKNTDLSYFQYQLKRFCFCRAVQVCVHKNGSRLGPGCMHTRVNRSGVKYGIQKITPLCWLSIAHSNIPIFVPSCFFSFNCFQHMFFCVCDAPFITFLKFLLCSKSLSLVHCGNP